MEQQFISMQIQGEREFQNLLPHSIELHLRTKVCPSSLHFLNIFAVGAINDVMQLIHCLGQNCVQLLQPLSRLDTGQPAQTEAQSTKEGCQKDYIYTYKQNNRKTQANIQHCMHYNELWRM